MEENLKYHIQISNYKIYLEKRKNKILDQLLEYGYSDIKYYYDRMNIDILSLNTKDELENVAKKLDEECGNILHPLDDDPLLYDSKILPKEILIKNLRKIKIKRLI